MNHAISLGRDPTRKELHDIIMWCRDNINNPAQVWVHSNNLGRPYHWVTFHQHWVSKLNTSLPSGDFRLYTEHEAMLFKMRWE